MTFPEDLINNYSTSPVGREQQLIVNAREGSIRVRLSAIGEISSYYLNLELSH